MKNFFLLILIFAVSEQSVGQFSQKERDSIYQLSVQDHNLMMDKLNIEKLRSGPSGNPSDPNAANTNESLVEKNLELPDPLIFNNGVEVTNEEEWLRRRNEILDDFNQEVYGQIPGNIPAVTWRTISEKDSVISNHPVIVKEMMGEVDNSIFPEIEVNIDMTVILPKNVEGEVPLILNFDWIWPSREKSTKSWEEELLNKKWGYASLIPTSYQADNGAGLRKGIIGLVNKGKPRQKNDWGALRAWAWGASRAMDYFVKSEKIDEERVAIQGLSRYGKAALVTLAYDQRFTIGFIGSSGAGGAKLLRRNFGEQIENLASASEYHWFAPNFIKYAGPLTVKDLPVDAHELIALVAPRPVFISTGNPSVEGGWVDARGMFLGALYAEPVYRLLGHEGMGVYKNPGVGKYLGEGDIGFRSHEKGHTVEPNWSYFIQFAEKYF
ncbi:MAG: acetylxylan esterase [Christiangramia sp.]|nr:acetylxylan esterase [Christiangramia sp.]